MADKADTFASISLFEKCRLFIKFITFLQVYLFSSMLSKNNIKLQIVRSLNQLVGGKIKKNKF